MTFYEWLIAKYRIKKGKFEDTRFGDLAKNLEAVINKNVFDEDFDEYNTLEDWLEHLDMHLAPKIVKATLVDAWEMYSNAPSVAELDCIKGSEDESN